MKDININNKKEKGRLNSYDPADNPEERVVNVTKIENRD